MEFPMPTFIAFSGTRGDHIHVEGDLASAVDAMSPNGSSLGDDPTNPDRRGGTQGPADNGLRQPGADCLLSRGRGELVSHGRGLASTFAPEMETGEHSSRELTVSVKVPCQECGGLGYIQRVKAGHIVGDKTKKCHTCRGRGLIPDDMPVSQLRELLK